MRPKVILSILIGLVLIGGLFWVSKSKRKLSASPEEIAQKRAELIHALKKFEPSNASSLSVIIQALNPSEVETAHTYLFQFVMMGKEPDQSSELSSKVKELQKTRNLFV